MNNVIVPQDIQERSRQRVAGFRKILNTLQPSDVNVGQIWATEASIELLTSSVETQEPRLVVVLAGHGALSEITEEIIAAPLSLETSMATDMDLLVPTGESSLNFRFIVELWNETPVLKGHLRRYLGRLSDAAAKALEAVYHSQISEQRLPDVYASWVGLPIMSQEDSRLAFQEEEVRAFSYLAQAAAAALGLEESKQEAETAEQSTNKSHFIFPHWTVSVPPVFRRLSEILHQDQFSGKQPSVAYAAGAEENETLLFLHESEDKRFLFELVNSRRPPYKIYLKVHILSGALTDQQCVVTVRTETEHLTSEPKMLKVGSEIVVGEDPYFERDTVESIEVIVEK